MPVWVRVRVTQGHNVCENKNKQSQSMLVNGRSLTVVHTRWLNPSYWCQIQALWLKVCYSVIYAISGPLFFVREPKSIIAVTGKNATLHCNASAPDTKIIYFWKFNGSFIHKDNNSGFKFSNGSLQIKNVTGTRHSATYECIAVAKDLGSIKSRKATLLIACK